MMFRRLAVIAAAATALSLVLAGCGNSSTSGSPTSSSAASGGASASGAVVDWAEKVCQSVQDDVAALAQPPDLDMTDPQKTKDGFVAYLGKVASSLDGFVNGLKQAGDPPVAGGAASVKEVTDALAKAKDSVAQARAELDKVSASDPDALQAAFAKIGEDLSSLSDLEDPTKDLGNNKDLEDAFAKAPTCKKIDQSTSSSSPPSS